MIEINYRGILWCCLIAAMAIGGIALVSGHVHAEPINLSELTPINGSYVVVTEEGPIEITAPNTTAEIPILSNRISHYIEQGELVKVGDQIDISGVVPPYPQLAYWNGYDMYDTPPTYNITLPDRKSGWYNFSVDPDIFNTRLGKWYKYNNKFERQGNNLAFIVAPRNFFNYTMTFPNGTTISVSELPEMQQIAPKAIPTPEILQPRHVADYLVTSTDNFNITVSNLSAVWIFDGHDNSIVYAMNDSSSQIVVDKKQIDHLEPGEYKIIIQSIGNMSKNLDVVFSDKKIKWFDRSAFAVRIIQTTNLVPSEAIRALENIFPLTYDTYQIKTLAVQDPEITIAYMNQVAVGSAKEYYNDPDRRGNVSLMDVRGYTNVLPGTNVSVTLDEARVNPREVSKFYTYKSTAKGTYLGEMRYYQVYVPLYWDSLQPGMHNLTARTEQGGFAVANFPVREETADYCSLHQDECGGRIRFVGDSNPWKPNLTIPEPVIVKETVVVPQTIIVPVTPSKEEVNAEAQRMIEEQNKKTESTIVVGIVILIGLAFIGWFGWSMWRAKK